MRRWPLLDYLVGPADQRQRDRHIQHLRGLEIDGHLELGDLLDREMGDLFSFKDSADINARLMVRLRDASAIAQESTGCGKIL